MSGSLDKQRKAFEADPDNTHAFEALEEHYFLEAKWSQLALLYQHRLEGEKLRGDPIQAAPLAFRLAQILEDRLDEAERAREQYKLSARLDPRYRPALQCLRRIAGSRGQWDVVLQIAEVEGQSNMSPGERADFVADIGQVWLAELDDPTEALGLFQQALGIDPDHRAALWQYQSWGISLIHGRRSRRVQPVDQPGVG